MNHTDAIDPSLAAAPLGLRGGWLVIAARFGSIQTLLLLVLFYVLLIGPMAIGAWVARRDLLDKRKRRTPDSSPSNSAWRGADTAGADLERAKLSS